MGGLFSIHLFSCFYGISCTWIYS